MHSDSDVPFSRKVLLLASAWAAAALAMTIIEPSSWSYFWRFAYCSPVYWLLSCAGASVSDDWWIYCLIVAGWLYYVALVAAAFWSNPEGCIAAERAALSAGNGFGVVGARSQQIHP